MEHLGNLPAEAERVFRALTAEGDLWLNGVPNKGPRRQQLYDRFPGIRSTGVYVLRDVYRVPGLFYVGKVVQDPEDPRITNPNADGIVGRLSGHQNMSGSNALARWYQYRHPEADVPPKVMAGALRDRIQAEAAPRIRVSFAQCPAEAASAIESYIIRCGLPGDDVPPILNSPNWDRRR